MEIAAMQNIEQRMVEISEEFYQAGCLSKNNRQPASLTCETNY
jgi:hypothetical protein